VPVAPAWCLTDRHLIVSLFPQTVKATLDRVIAEEDAIARNPAFEKLDGCLAVSFMDLPRLARNLYPILLPLARLGCAELQLQGVDLTVAHLPTFASVVPHLVPECLRIKRVKGGILADRRGVIPDGGPVVGMLLPYAMIGFTVAVEVSPAMRVDPSTPPPPAPAPSTTKLLSADLNRLHQAMNRFKKTAGRDPRALEELWSGDHAVMDRPLRAPNGQSYLYLPPGDRPGGVVVAAPVPYRGQRIVLYADGSIGAMPEDRFQRLRLQQGAAPEKKKAQAE
jgi:hypothetical protein